MRRALFLTLLCACSTPETADPAAPSLLTAADFPADTDWLELAREAVAQAAWPDARFFLDQREARQPADLSEEYWELRLQCARGGRDAAGAAASRAALLLRLQEPREDPEEQLRAWRRASALYEEAGEFREAAALLELAASHPAAGARAPAWWEKCSWLWERAGDRGAATRAIERALAGIELAAREQAALARLQAFELGHLSSVADAQAVLRFEADPEARVGAARYLAGAVFEDDVAVFARALSDPEPRVLQICLRQLAERTGPGEGAFVNSQVAPFALSADLELRLAALGVLAVTGGREQVPLLLKALQPEDRASFRGARRALEAVTGHAEPAPMDPDLEGRRQLREAWLAWWKSETGN